ncbi:hypothetical protein B566_EDAN018878 [Ephemera danica]|nr:hypothetical protein B566_EDAN018878 [Ephemera danica]
MFDADWQAHGLLDRVVTDAADWVRSRKVPGLTLEVVRLPGRTPCLFFDVPATRNAAQGSGDTVLMYGHLDKQPEFNGWRNDLGPWTPKMEAGRLYGRGGADDGYAVYAAITAIEALDLQGIARPRCVGLIETCEESGSPDLPAYLDALKARLGQVGLVVCLDSGAGNYDQLWLTTSLRGMVSGVLKVQVLTEGIHSGDASGLVPSSFRVLRHVLDRLEDSASGELLPRSFHCEVPGSRLAQAQATAKILKDEVYKRFPWACGMDGGSVLPTTTDPVQVLLNRTWRPTLSVTGVEGFPDLSNAGNVLRPYTAFKLSLRLPPLEASPHAGLRISTAVERVSDDDWWKDFPRAHQAFTARLLPSRLRVEQDLALGSALGPALGPAQGSAQGSAPGSAQGPAQGQLYAGAQWWQTLQAADSPITAPYQRGAQAGLSAQGPAPGGLQWTLQTEVNRFTRGSGSYILASGSPDTRPEGWRWHAQGLLALPWRGHGWWVTPRAQVNMAHYRMDEPMTDGRTRRSRTIPTFSVDSGLEFERETAWLGRRLRQTLEPRLFYVNTPYHAQATLPTFDAAEKDFNLSSIYSENAFSGVDRVSDAHQVTAGFTTRWLDADNGAEALRLSLVQRYLFREQRITPEGVPFTRHLSDLLLLAATTVVPELTLDARVQYSPDIQRPVRSIVGARYSPGPFRTVGASYRFSRGLSELVDLGWQWPVYRGQPANSGQGCQGTLYSVGRASYSMRDSRLTDALVGMEYDAGCWIARVAAERLSTGLSTATTRYHLQLELVGLSRLGSNPLKPGQALIEIGPGLGALTRPLFERCPGLQVVELDRDLAARLRHWPGLGVIESDVLKVDFRALSAQHAKRMRVVGNLPYNVSTPILFHLLPQADCIEDQHFMLQREVVQRMCASPGHKEYGRLSVMLQWRYQLRSVLEVPPGAFEPAPKPVPTTRFQGNGLLKRIETSERYSSFPPEVSRVAEDVEQLLAGFAVETCVVGDLIEHHHEARLRPGLVDKIGHAIEQGIKVLAEMRRKHESLGDGVKNILLRLGLGQTGVEKMLIAGGCGTHQILHPVGPYGLHDVGTDRLQLHGRVPPGVKQNGSS